MRLAFTGRLRMRAPPMQSYSPARIASANRFARVISLVKDLKCASDNADLDANVRVTKGNGEGHDAKRVYTCDSMYD